MEQYRRIWGRRIRDLRRAAGYSQRQLSVAMDCDQAMVSRWERGLGAPRDDNRVRLAAILGVEATWLFSYDTNGDHGEAA